MKKVGKIISACIVLMLLLGWSVIAAVQYQNRQIETKIRVEDAIDRDAAYTEAILKETYSTEFLKFWYLCDASIKVRKDLIIELRGLYPSGKNRMNDQLIEFLRTENDFVLAKKWLYTSKLLFLTKLKTSSTGQESLPFATNLVDSGVAFVRSYDEAVKMEPEVAYAATQLSIRFKPLFRSYSDSNLKEGHEQIDQASHIIYNFGYLYGDVASR
jgi:hypothetical protein